MKGVLQQIWQLRKQTAGKPNYIPKAYKITKEPPKSTQDLLNVASHHQRKPDPICISERWHVPFMIII